MSNQYPADDQQAVDRDRRSPDSHAIKSELLTVEYEAIESVTASFRESLAIGQQTRDQIQQTLEMALDSSLRLTTYPQPMTFSAKHLENKLWSGYSRYAIPALKALTLDRSLPPTERYMAAYQLARRCLVDREYSQAQENLELAKGLTDIKTPQLVVAETHCLLLLGRCIEALKCLDDSAQRKSERDYPLLRSMVVRHVEIANGSTPEQVDAAQLAALNAAFEKTGLTPVQKRNSDAPLSISNLLGHAHASNAPQTQRLSIIMPAFNAEKSIEWALASIREQTWRNLEIIVVDDKSTDTTAEIVTRITTLDHRVRLIRQPSTRGLYAACNAGVRVATGDLIVIHESHDWSHPQRMELQIKGLHDNPQAAAVQSLLARVNESIEVQISWNIGATLLLPAPSSLMFRREALDHIGMWDEVSAGADGELLYRLKAVFGTDAIVDTAKKHLLSLSLVGEESAEHSATTSSSTKHGSHWNYRDSYTFWHTKAIQEKHAGKPLLFNGSFEARSFPVPLGNRHGHTVISPYDLIVIGDFAAKGAALDATLNHLKNAGRNGRKIAAFHWRHYESGGKDSLQPAFYEACLRYHIDILTSSDVVSADTILINPPALLQYRLDVLPTFHADRVAVLVDLVEGGAGEYKRYDPLVVRSHLRSIFGNEGVWIATSSRVRQLMQNDTRFPKPVYLSSLAMLRTAESSAKSPDEVVATAASGLGPTSL